MRVLITAVFNLVTLVVACLTAPLRLASRRRRPLYVHVKMSGALTYRRGRGRRWALRGRRDPAAVDSVDELGRWLRILGKDPAVRGIVLHAEGLHVTSAKRAAVVALLEAFRSEGKQVVAFAVAPSTGDYALLCAADRILLPAAGRVELTGFSAELSALGAGLQRLGVQPHFIRRGDHKTAPELFTREAPSEIQKEVIGGLLDEAQQELVQTVAQGRHLTADQARERIDGGPYSARRALDAGLCDALCSEADLPKELFGADADEDDPRLGSFARYASTRLWPRWRFRPLRRRPRLAVVPVNGIIVPGDGVGVPGGPALAGSDAVIRAVRAAARDSSCPAILLFVDSPGGSALASELILDEVKRAAVKKPLLAYFDQVAASGGYMAALGGKEIWSAPRAIVGSIGVFAGKFDASELLAKLGIHRTVLTRGANAAMLSMSRGFTEHEQRTLEAEVEETYQSFLAHVAAARSKTKDEVHAVGEGRIFSGTRAREAGLVDRVSSLDEACRRAFELAGQNLLSTQDYDVSLFTAPRRRFAWLNLLQSLARWSLYAVWEPGISLGGILENSPY